MLHVLVPDLVPEYLAAIPASDPWGQPHRYWTNGEHFMIGSGGPEAASRRWRNELERNPRGASQALESLCRSPGWGAVLLIDELPKDITHGPSTGSLTDEERGRLTVEDLRAIALAVMECGIDHNAYPVAGDAHRKSRCL